MSEPVLRVFRVTMQGFGNRTGQLPKYIQHHLEKFSPVQTSTTRTTRTTRTRRQRSDSVVANAQAQYRCKREGFVAFDTLTGQVTDWAKQDGVPLPSTRIQVNSKGELTHAPIYVAMLFYSLNNNANNDGNTGSEFIGAMATLFLQADNSVKLEYLCAAPRFKGAGKALLRKITMRDLYFPDAPRRIVLDDDTEKRHGQRGFYSKMGFAKTGEKARYTSITHPNKSKYLDIYNKSLASPSLSPEQWRLPSIYRYLPPSVPAAIYGSPSPVQQSPPRTRKARVARVTGRKPMTRDPIVTRSPPRTKRRRNPVARFSPTPERRRRRM